MKIITTAFEPTMKSELAIRKGGQVATFLRGEEEKPKSASPQLLRYLMFLCLLSLFFSIPSTIFRSKLQSFRQQPGGVFVNMTFVTISVTILACAILVFTCCYLKSYMRIIHYTGLKTVGSLSGILAAFFFELVLFVPENPSKTMYTLIVLISVGIMVGYRYLWKFAISHQQHTDFNELYSPWLLFVPVLIPLHVVSSPFIPKNLNWILLVWYHVQTSIICITAIKMLETRPVMPLGTSPAIQQDQRQDH